MQTPELKAAMYGCMCRHASALCMWQVVCCCRHVLLRINMLCISCCRYEDCVILLCCMYACMHVFTPEQQHYISAIAPSLHQVLPAACSYTQAAALHTPAPRYSPPSLL
eukprot:GHUV01023063.1.p2 GENE.GHUV01023063.1~~GHUV01023063.1.p2  ORF type:complete len:109 (-),score=10.15 GHUV01023063.1:32-358(-)